MTRGDLYRVRRPPGDTRPARVFVVVSRQAVLDSRFSTAMCAPIYSRRDGLASQVDLGIEDGLKNESCVHCDELLSLHKSVLTDFVATLSPARLRAVDDALRVALALA